jgi:RNA-directed DNA polymerase
VDALKSPGKPFEISKRAVWEAWEKVRANKGAPGVDGESIDGFEKDLQGNLYKIWNRMSSGTYFPPPVRAVEIAKAHGTGTRMLGVPTVTAYCVWGSRTRPSVLTWASMWLARIR